jgi:hypothetical protein
MAPSHSPHTCLLIYDLLFVNYGILSHTEPEIEKYVEEWRVNIIVFLLTKMEMHSVSLASLSSHNIQALPMIGLSEIGASVPRPTCKYAIFIKMK